MAHAYFSNTLHFLTYTENLISLIGRGLVTMSLDLSSDALCGISYVRFVCVCDGGVGLDRAGGKGRCSPRETELERASVECLSRSLDRETDRPMWKRAGWLAGWLHQEGGVDVSTCSRMIYLISHSIMNFWPIISRAPITHKELIMGRKIGLG